MIGYLAGLSLLAGAVLLSQKDPCPPHFELGQSYHEVQQGPCPDLDSLPAFKSEDSVHVAYLCRSKQTMVVGSVVTGKMDAFFLWDGK